MLQGRVSAFGGKPKGGSVQPICVEKGVVYCERGGGGCRIFLWAWRWGGKLGCVIGILHNGCV